MPKITQEKTNARKEEIIGACEKLYKTMSFKEITIKEIGKATSFTRTSIYNYFQTKEEIFLALLKREYELWIASLRQTMAERKAMTKDEFADMLAHLLAEKGMTQADLCKATNIGAPSISQYLKGIHKPAFGRYTIIIEALT